MRGEPARKQDRFKALIFMDERKRIPTPETAEAAPYGQEAADYARNLKMTFVDLEKDLKFDAEAFSFGPVFHLKTSRGQEIQVKTFAFEKENKNSFRGDFIRQKHLYLVAVDSAGRILGNRMMYLYYYNPQEKIPTIDARGQITTRFRGLGLSSVIDLANKTLLQDEVDRYGGTLRWGIINGNRADLASLKKPKPNLPGLTRETKPPQLEQQEIADKEQEQERWQKLYGPLGKLGSMGSTNFDEDDFEVVLQARKIPANFSRAQEVWLERDPEEHFEEPRIKNLTVVEAEQQTALKRNKWEELQGLYLQMKGILDAAK